MIPVRHTTTVSITSPLDTFLLPHLAGNHTHCSPENLRTATTSPELAAVNHRRSPEPEKTTG
ncbi:hypothetical protein HanXRQr2_Chr17g0806101 [Helianthus annuus]|uniref:Uncharacterized protein n=1 Tax=Helianthus annuus TaxID=4232 RepID=A0A9K3DHX5_HELAN|nr:hypothetical protein HanXRQr2_Chr17g0806081 [Helianthus annuus]KAF5755731.1 hypothetical protein HanXRQr2_Chr17g0806101 [Helianthus annuus]KAJ0932830.1 hypothetical protein HanPSC8_Chr04g0178161 [Helianthus annuus]